MSLEHYKENNARLASSLNEARTEVGHLKAEVVRLNHALQQSYTEVVVLKKQLREKDLHCQALTMKINDHIKYQTTGLTQLMMSVNTAPEQNAPSPREIGGELELGSFAAE